MKSKSEPQPTDREKLVELVAQELCAAELSIDDTDNEFCVQAAQWVADAIIEAGWRKQDGD